MLNKLRSYIDSRFLRGDIHRNNGLGALHRAWGHIYSNRIKGDYVEFGVYKGASLLNSYRCYLEFKNWIDGQLTSPELWRRDAARDFSTHTPKFYGLDTFEGMPNNNESEVCFLNNSFMSDFNKVKSLLSKHGLNDPQLILLKGLFSTNKSNLMNVKNAAIVHIDCDLYESTKDALSIISPAIGTGTVILFDDYNAFSADNNKGERRAFREFSETSKHKFEPWFAYGYSGQAFLCVE